MKLPCRWCLLAHEPVEAAFAGRRGAQDSQRTWLTLRPKKSTGHEHWVREGNPFRKVTLSAHNEPFDDFIVGSMARQAGVSVRAFYDALK